MEEHEAASVYIPEEIISEILLRVGLKFLFRVKSVSKQWNSMIADPEFGRNYMNRCNKSPSCSSKLLLWGYFGSFTQTSTNVDVGVGVGVHAPSLYLPDDHTHVLASSNGLVLCGSYTKNCYTFSNLYVCNPLIKQAIALPNLVPRLASLTAMKIYLATRISPSYKVVVIVKRRIFGIPYWDISIYSSATGTWSQYAIDEKNCPAVVYSSSPSACSKGGILHWLDFGAKRLVTYDPYDAPERFGCTELPTNLGVRVIHLGQEDVVRFGEMKDLGGGDRRLMVWRLYGELGWAIEQTCLISPSWVHSPLVQDYFCCLGVEDEERVSRIDIIEGVIPQPLGNNVPFALCPWADPSSSSSAWSETTSFRRVSPVWFSPRNNYSSLLDWHSNLLYWVMLNKRVANL